MCMKYFLDCQFQEHCVVTNINGSTCINSKPASIIPLLQKQTKYCTLLT